MAKLKREKLKGPDVGPEKAARRHRRRVKPGAQGRGTEAKAINPSGKVNAVKLKRNRRERLGVGPGHRTPKMQKRQRGTYP
jgi:hypothetical protein